MRLIRLVSGLIAAVFVSSCVHESDHLKDGIWRGTFILPGNEIPFLFEVKKTGSDSDAVFLINGSDHFKLDHVLYRKDSVTITADLYNSILSGKLTGGSISGRFIKNGTGKKDEGIPFKAEWGNSQRFPSINEPPAFSLSGTWNIEMQDNGNTEKTVGIFNQKNESLTGSILTISGDYRYLDGIVYGNKFLLSEFCGSTPYLVRGEFSDDNHFTGQFITPRSTSELKGTRDPSASLPDPFSISRLREGFSSISFTFPDLNGKMVSLSDPAYTGKVVVVTILGSWCPNCLDENTFLSSWYKKNHKRGVEIIGLGFERKDDFKDAQKSLSLLKKRLDIPYKILVAGKSTTKAISEALPALTGIIAFPTTIFIDKKGNVSKIHTGFSGPATGKFYDEFKTEFNQLIDQLLAE